MAWEYRCNSMYYVWCGYLLGVYLVRKTGLSYVCGTFLKRVWAETSRLCLLGGYRCGSK